MHFSQAIYYLSLLSKPFVLAYGSYSLFIAHLGV